MCEVRDLTGFREILSILGKNQKQEKLSCKKRVDVHAMLIKVAVLTNNIGAQGTRLISWLESIRRERIAYANSTYQMQV